MESKLINVDREKYEEIFRAISIRNDDPNESVKLLETKERSFSYKAWDVVSSSYVIMNIIENEA
jgi:hypothetical protein